ncbi:TPA: hypothetical protein ACH3X1_001445 [Trebouxia sp. C0004]
MPIPCRLSGGYQLLACEDQYARLSMLSSSKRVQWPHWLVCTSKHRQCRSNVTFLELAPSFSGPYSPEGRAPLQSPARLAALNGSSEGNRTNSAGKQAGQPATAHSNIQEHSAPSFVEAASVTRDLVNVISPFKPEAAKQARLHGASQTTVPRFLSPGSKALTDSAAAAEDNMAVMHGDAQPAHPAAIPNSSETQPSISKVNWKRMLPNSPAATEGDPLLDAALRLNKSHEDCITAPN